jgi:uncharacterized SAM-binding protein YcdF (DUF218 family)
MTSLYKIALGALVVGISGIFAAMMIFMRIGIYLGMVFGFLAVLWAIGFGWFAASVVTMTPQNPNEKTDAIIVLTGGDKRIVTGLDLLSTGMADKVFISGVHGAVSLPDITAKWGGDPSLITCCVTLGYQASTTSTNATESAQWIADQKISSIRLVTSNYHMLRSSLLFHQVLPLIKILHHPVSPDHFDPAQRQFWLLTFEEYNKLLLTWLRLDMLTKNPSLKATKDIL